MAKKVELREIGEAELQTIILRNRTELLKNQKYRADLRRVNLRGRQLFSVDLQRADFTEADLTEANLAKAVLDDAIMTDALLDRAFLTGANLRKVELINANLRGTVAEGAHFEGANLSNANIRGARIRNSDFSGANLLGCDLRGADLSNAVLRTTDLTEADLREADLRDAHFRKDAEVEGSRDAKGLTTANIGGANVALADLPEDIHKFEGLNVIEEASKNARKIFISMLLGCVYSWLTIAQTTDVQLLKNLSSSPLPIIQTPVPIVGFFLVAPALLLGLYVYFYLYMQRLWEGLAELPAVFPDGQPLDKKAYPWLLLGMVRIHFRRLRDDRPPLSWLQALVSIILAWGVVPFTILLFWWKYRRVEESWITLLHFVLVVIAIFFGVYVLMLARKTLRMENPESLWHPVGGNPFTWKFLNGFFPIRMVIILGAFMFFSSEPSLYVWPVNFDGAEITVGLADRTGKESQDVSFDLSWRRFPYALMSETFLSDANLSNVELRGADLSGSIIQNANLRFANLRGANLSDTILTNSDLTSAILNNATLAGTNLNHADVTGVHFECGVKALTVGQVKMARNWELAFYDSRMIEALGLRDGHNEFVEKTLWVQGVETELNVPIEQCLIVDKE